MKKSFLLMGLAVAALSFTNCNKQEVEIPAAGDPFAIQLTSVEETRTTNDGMATKWVEGDALSVFYATAGSTSFSANNQFSITNAEANLATADITLAEGTYDWYAFYPYNSHFTSPANNNDDPGRTYIGSRSDRSQTQTGYNNMDHVAGSDVPLYGLAKNVASGDVPQIQMKHIASVIEIAVTNQSGSAVTITGAELSAPEGTDIVGQYNISFDKDEPTFKKVSDFQSNTASLSVNNGTALANGSTAKLYLVVKPFTASSLTLKVNTDKGNQEKSISLSTPATFAAGHIKTLNFAVTSTSAEKGTLGNPYTASEAYEAASQLSSSGSIPNVYVTGIVSKLGSSFSNDILKFGNATYFISDDGTTSASQFEIFRGLYLNGANFTSEEQLAKGDIVIVYGTIVNYNSQTPEMSQGNYLYSIERNGPVVAEITVPRTNYTVYEEETVDLGATTNSSASISYVSSDNSIATVNSSGIVTGVSEGVVTITLNVPAVGTEFTAAETTVTVTVNAKADVVSGTWVKTSFTSIADGDEFVVVSSKSGQPSYAMSNDAKGAKGQPLAVAVTVSGNILSSVPENVIWKMQKSGSSTVFLSGANNATWLYQTANNNGLRTGTGETKQVSMEDGYLTMVDTKDAKRYIGVYYNNADWRSYTNIASNIKDQTFTFYVKQ